MSRTYRRLDVSKEYLWQEERARFCTYTVGARWLFPRLLIPDEISNEHVVKVFNLYYSDKQSTMRQVPSWYKRTFCRQAYRAKERHTLNRVRQGEIDTPFPMNKKNSKYYW